MYWHMPIDYICPMCLAHFSQLGGLFPFQVGLSCFCCSYADREDWNEGLRRLHDSRSEGMNDHDS